MISNINLSFSNLLWHSLIGALTFIVFLILYVFYKVYIVPQVKMNFYKKQGIKCFYFPLLGHFKKQKDGLEQHGDSYYFSKTRARKEPVRAMCSHLLSDIHLILYDPALLKEYYLNTDNYIKDPGLLQLYGTVFGEGLGTSEGHKWKTQRKIISNVFHFEFLKGNLPVTQATAHENLYNIRKTSLTNVDIMNVFQSITGEVVGKIFFGEEMKQFKLNGKPLTVALADLIIDVAEVSRSLSFMLFGASLLKKGIFPKYRKIMQEIVQLRGLCRQIIEERKTQSNSQKELKTRKDMLDLLLEYKGEEGKMNEEEIIDQFISFFIAGMDTTGHLATIALYQLYTHPEHMKKVLEEIRQNYPYGKEVTMGELNKLDFTMRFLKESLRTMSPAPGMFPRRAIKDHKLKDIHVKKGDNLWFDFFYNNFNPEHFENPDKIVPDRWLEKEKKVDAYAGVANL